MINVLKHCEFLIGWSWCVHLFTRRDKWHQMTLWAQRPACALQPGHKAKCLQADWNQTIQEEGLVRQTPGRSGRMKKWQHERTTSNNLFHLQKAPFAYLCFITCSIHHASKTILPTKWILMDFACFLQWHEVTMLGVSLSACSNPRPSSLLYWLMRVSKGEGRAWNLKLSSARACESTLYHQWFQVKILNMGWNPKPSSNK